MPPKTAVLPHIGRKIERIRTIKGIKQKELADMIGMQQGTLSKIEQSENVDDEKLKIIAAALELSPDAIKNFNEEALVNLINNIHNNSFDNHSIAFIYNFFNPVEKITELYERLLATEREKIVLLESLLKKYEGTK